MPPATHYAPAMSARCQLWVPLRVHHGYMFQPSSAQSARLTDASFPSNRLEACAAQLHAVLPPSSPLSHRRIISTALRHGQAIVNLSRSPNLLLSLLHLVSRSSSLASLHSLRYSTDLLFLPIHYLPLLADRLFETNEPTLEAAGMVSWNVSWPP